MEGEHSTEHVGRERVLVTGGSGFIASHVVEVFREAGFSVATTVRSGKGAAGDYFRARGVEVFEADLQRPDGWAEAVAGCHFVIHVASPFQLNVKDGQKDLIEPAVAGTRHLLEACANSKALRRVVLTSSVAAVSESSSGVGPFTEDNWNEAANVKESPYSRSKVEAERFAWSFVGLHKADIAWDLVTVNPSGVFGPVLLPPASEAQVNVSNQLLVKILNRSYPGYPNFALTAVDVRDCARAHLLAATTAAARGRFIVCAGETSMAAVAGILLEKVRVCCAPLCSSLC
jgi:dihydroflavonol-4-reductase